MGRVLAADRGRHLGPPRRALRHDARRRPTRPATATAPPDGAAPRTGATTSPSALAKHGLERRDVAPNVNLFKGVRVEPDGTLTFDGDPAPGRHVELRAELPLLVTVVQRAPPARPPPRLHGHAAAGHGVAGRAGGRRRPAPHRDPRGRAGLPQHRAGGAYRGDERRRTSTCRPAGRARRGGAGPGAVVARRASRADAAHHRRRRATRPSTACCYDAHDPVERYSAPDTIVAQGNVFLVDGHGAAVHRGQPDDDDHRHVVRPPRHHRRRLLARSRTPSATGSTPTRQHACVENFVHELGRARPGQARPPVEHQLVHERARRPRRQPRHRRRHLGARACGSTCGPSATCSSWCRTARRSTTRATASTRRRCGWSWSTRAPGRDHLDHPPARGRGRRRGASRPRPGRAPAGRAAAGGEGQHRRGRPAHHRRLPGLRLRARRRQRAGGRPPRAPPGAVVVGQDQPRPVRHRPGRHPQPLRRARQPGRAGPRERRLLERLGRGGGPRRGRPRPGHRHRRLGPGARGVLRHRRAQAHPGLAVRRRAWCRPCRSLRLRRRCSPATWPPRPPACEAAAGFDAADPRSRPEAGGRRRPAWCAASACPPPDVSPPWCDPAVAAVRRPGAAACRRSASIVGRHRPGSVPRRRRPALRRRPSWPSATPPSAPSSPPTPTTSTRRWRPSIDRRGGVAAAELRCAAQQRLAELRRAGRGRLGRRSTPSLVPTAPRHPTLAEVAADPVGVNAALGRFTNGCNLLGWCAAAVPGGTRGDGLPFGVTAARPGVDRPAIWAAAARSPARSRRRRPGCRAPAVLLAVCGAHLEGQPLNHQLPHAGRRLVARTATAPPTGWSASTPRRPSPASCGWPTTSGGARSRSRCGRSTPPASARSSTRCRRRWRSARSSWPTAPGSRASSASRTPSTGAEDITAHGGWRAWLATADRAGAVPR